MKSSNRAISSFEQPGQVKIVELPRRCVFSDHLEGGQGCQASIPIRTVAAAWQRELELRRTSAGFFHFAWRGEVWLAYGMPDGSVRGVYCPAHRAEREQRLGYDPELVRTPEPQSKQEPAVAYAG